MPRPLLKPYASLFSGVLRLLDPAASLASGAVVYAVHPPVGGAVEHYALFQLVAALAIAATFPLFGLYQAQRGFSVADEVRKLIAAWLLLAAVAGIALFFTKSGSAFSRIFVLSWLAGGFALTAAVRVTLRMALRAFRRRGRNLRHVAIVGAGTLGQRVASQLAADPGAGLNVIGYYDDDPAKLGTTLEGRTVIAPTGRLCDDIAVRGIDQVWIAMPLRAEARVSEILAGLRDQTVEIRFVPDIFGFHLLNHSMSDVAGLPVILLTATPMTGGARIAKMVEDYVLGAVCFVLALPAMLLIAVGIRLSSAGPVLYRQARVTWNGRRFAMLKFRTMPVTAEAASGAVWSRKGESRATPFGAFLRRYSLDELPQLVNVLRGEMSLVGPRPERPEFVERFRHEIPGYMQKHLVKGGITGWAQIHDLRGDSDLVRRIEYDLYYIDHWSLWLDLRILGLTLWHLVTTRNAQ
jgi:putative colanic acid biosysnthesis UDP-glucose lipid carrier transferase